MLKFRILLLAASLASARLAASAQSASAPAARATPAVPSPAPAAQAPAPSGAAPDPRVALCNGATTSVRRAKLPPAGSGAARLPGGPLLRQAGRDVGHRPADLSLLHPAAGWSLPSQDKWVPYTDEDRADRSSGTSSALGTNFLDDLSVETVRLRLLQRRRRQDRRSTTWRSASASRSSTTSDRRRSSSRRSTRS